MKTVSQYKEDIKALMDKVASMDAKCIAEGRDLTPAEVEVKNEMMDTVDEYGGIVKALERQETINAQLTATPQAVTVPKRHIITVEERAAKDKFNSFGQQMAAIMRAGIPGGRVDPRLLNAATGLSETVPSDGGLI